MSDAIDAHNHFWKYEPEEYAWLGSGMEQLRRNFEPDDLLIELRGAGVAGTIAVQARQTLEETRWLLDLADTNDFIRGVVGWAPLAESSVEKELEQLRDRRKLKGIRHVVQDEPDDNFILRDDFNRGVQQLQKFDLVYDILIFERQLPQAIEFVDRHPSQVFVLDHVAKPRIRDGEISPWRERITELARRENVSCKISGMVTEASWTEWKDADLAPYVDAVLEAFGPKRLMFGSDWPVLLVASSYVRWVNVVRGLLASLSADEKQDIMGDTAVRVYNL